jgi:hypothetical protein
LASSIGGLTTGERGERGILDDPHSALKGRRRLRAHDPGRFRESMSNSVNDIARSAMVVIMQRVHEEDSSGVILEGEFDQTSICIPMEFDSMCHPVLPPGAIDHEKTANQVDRGLTHAQLEEGELIDVTRIARAWNGPAARFPFDAMPARRDENGSYSYNRSVPADAGSYQSA